MTVGISGKIGTSYTFGATYVRNTGEEPIVLTSVGWIRQPPAIEVLGTQVAGANREINIGASERFPDPRLADVVDAVPGYRVLPSDPTARATEILIGVRPTEAGRHALKGLEIGYRVGDTEYVTRVDHDLILCMVDRPPLGRECR